LPAGLDHAAIRIFSKHRERNALAHDIAVKEIVQEEKRPDKTIYRITEQGRARFLVLLAEQFAEHTPNYHPLYPALLFTRFGDEDVIREALMSRREKMEHKAARVELRIRELEARIHWGSLQIMKNSLLHLRTEMQ
jgi:DNA-binding PadR family transcriptional regulator